MGIVLCPNCQVAPKERQDHRDFLSRQGNRNLLTKHSHRDLLSPNFSGLWSLQEHFPSHCALWSHKANFSNQVCSPKISLESPTQNRIVLLIVTMRKVEKKKKNSNFYKGYSKFLLHLVFISAIGEEAIRSHFSDCGDITNIRIVRDRATSLGKGICYVQFEVIIFLFPFTGF